MRTKTLETSVDTLLDGRVRLEQPLQGHRAGTDGVLLASLAPLKPGDRVADVGAGVGTVGLCAASRIQLSGLTFIERDPYLAQLAEQNATQNAFMSSLDWRVTTFNILAPARERTVAGLHGNTFDHVLMNPPFDQPDRVRASPDERKRAAYLLEEDGFLPWIKFARWMLKPHGQLSVIFRPQNLPDVLAACSGRFGGADIRPLHTRDDAPARRLLVTLQAGSKGPMRIFPSVVLREGNLLV